MNETLKAVLASASLELFGERSSLIGDFEVLQAPFGFPLFLTFLMRWRSFRTMTLAVEGEPLWLKKTSIFWR